MGALFSGVLIATGAVVGAFIIGHWAAGGFGELDMARPLFFSSLCLINGVQLGAASYLFSIMALPRRMDALAPEDRETAIRDIP